MGDLRPIVRRWAAVVLGAMEIEQHHVAGWILPSRARSSSSVTVSPGCLWVKSRSTASPMSRSSGKLPASRPVAIVVVGKLHVRAAMGRHFHVLQDVPHVRVALILRIQLVGKMGLQAEMVLFLVGQQLVTEVNDSAVQHGDRRLKVGSKFNSPCLGGMSLSLTAKLAWRLCCGITQALRGNVLCWSVATRVPSVP